MSAVHLSKEDILNEDIRVSIGSLAILHIKDVKLLARPTTIYLMVNERCVFNCAYCAQARKSKANIENLSRVTWPKEKFATVLNALEEMPDAYKRICFQVVNGVDSFDKTYAFVEAIREKNIKAPISVAIREFRVDRLEKLFQAGVERIGLPLDVVSEKAFEKLRGGNYQKTIAQIVDIGKRFKGHITTHIIVGLDETDRELYNALKLLFDNDILVSLFAFTPVKDTPLENHPKLPLERYRKWQFVRSLFFKGIPFEPVFSGDELIGVKINLKEEELQELLNDGSNYMTQGCKACNRPFYNETPTGPMYNFPMMPKEVPTLANAFVKEVSDGSIQFKEN